MNRIGKAIITAVLSFAVAVSVLILQGRDEAVRAAIEPSSIAASVSALPGAQNGCPIIFPDGPVVVAPNQPAVQTQSTIGIINALCDVTLDFVGCGFTPSSVSIACDTNGDGVSDLSIPLKNITFINGLLFQATIPALATTPGSPFPLVCCGGETTITLSRTVTAGDDNAFGTFTQTINCSIDLGIRAPVIISATPSDGDCANGQNLLIPGACFVLATGKPNVTSVFAVEVGNPNNVIQASTVQILSGNLIDAFFQFGPANAGKTFLIYASGPNGTSRNLTQLPAGAQAGCPLGNEQGIQVTFKCKSAGASGGPADAPSAGLTPLLSSCRVDRDEAGSFALSILGKGIRDGATVTVGGKTPKKVKLKERDPVDGAFTLIIVKKKFCDGLPGQVVVTNPNGVVGTLFCGDRCLNQ